MLNSKKAQRSVSLSLITSDNPLSTVEKYSLKPAASAISSSFITVFPSKLISLI